MKKIVDSMEELPSKEKLIEQLVKQRQAVATALIYKSIEFQSLKLLLSKIDSEIQLQDLAMSGKKETESDLQLKKKLKKLPIQKRGKKND